MITFFRTFFQGHYALQHFLAQRDWHLFVPKTFTVLHQGYRATDFASDLVAGMTVAIVALPLAMALAIASGATPDKGLITAVIAGFLISALGGSRFQIGGPTGAFVVVVFNVIARHGYDGLLIATFLAGFMLVVAGLLRLGTWIKYIPDPVVSGFTAGIAVIIASSQIKDFLGLSVEQMPADFLGKLAAFWDHWHSFNPWAFAIASTSLLIVVLGKKFLPRWPGFLVVVLLAALATYAFQLPIETIGSKFGAIKGSIPMPSLPAISLVKIGAVFPSAFTIAFLAGIESLLCAIVADGMTGRRHRSNCELVAQGIANIASALFGALPATGAIARTATNIRAGAKTPVAGMLHAILLLIAMMILAPLSAYIPLAVLAAILIIVAWNMSEIEKFRTLFSVPIGDSLVLLTTFGLTIFVDLTVAIQAGVVMGAILFMHRMAEIVAIRQGGNDVIREDQDDFTRTPSAYTARKDIPAGVEVFNIQGPMFFGAANRMTEVLDRFDHSPRVLIIRMRDVPLIDSSGLTLFRALIGRCKRQGTRLVLTELKPEVKETLNRAHLDQSGGAYVIAPRFEDALEYASALDGEEAYTAEDHKNLPTPTS